MKAAMRYFSGKRKSYGIPLLSNEWGSFTFFIEVEDQHVVRQVNQYENEKIVRYDRLHWCDRFGFMYAGKFSRKQKAGNGMTKITCHDFARIWDRALAEAAWSEQQAHQMMHEWGNWESQVS